MSLSIIIIGTTFRIFLCNHVLALECCFCSQLQLCPNKEGLYASLQYYSNLQGTYWFQFNTGVSKVERQLITTENSCILSQEIHFFEQRLFTCKRNFAHKLQNLIVDCKIMAKYYLFWGKMSKQFISFWYCLVNLTRKL